jgi:hypothetical protein
MTGQSRWQKKPAGRGDDPAQVDAEHYDEKHARHLQKHRPVVNDQPRQGQQGISSDKPGVDAGGYPEEPPTEPDPDRPGGASI